MINGGPQAAVAGGGFLLPGLGRRWRDVPFAGVPFFFGCRSRIDSAGPAVKADVAHGGVDDRLVECVVNDRAVYVHDRGVVEEASALPVSAPEANAAVSESIVNATVEADMFSPVATVPGIGTVVPTPISRRP